jgi:hypothetical protein
MKRLGWLPTRLRPAGRDGPQYWVYRRPGVPSPGSSEEVKKGLLLAFTTTTPRSEFTEEGSTEGT